MFMRIGGPQRSGGLIRRIAGDPYLECEVLKPRQRVLMLLAYEVKPTTDITCESNV